MKIAVAQIRPETGNLESNLEKHLMLVEKAAINKAGLILFPELSLTGYEPRLAEKLATHPEDPEFEELHHMSEDLEIIICAGMPVIGPKGIHISMLIFRPGKPVEEYSKQLLHPDELPFFTEGSRMIFLRKGDEKIAPAICYESLQPDFAEGAYKGGAQIYLASVAKSSGGLEEAMPFYASIAKKYSMTVCMSNSVGWCDDFMSAGRSSVWNPYGELVGSLGGSEEGLLVFDTLNGSLRKET